MKTLPERVSKAWEDRDGPIVLATVDEQGVPNAIYASCVKKLNDGQWVVADNYFHKTRANIEAGSRASLLFITSKRKSCQLKGTLSYETEGPVYDEMKVWVKEMNPKLPGVAAVVLTVDEIYCGAEKLL